MKKLLRIELSVSAAPLQPVHQQTNQAKGGEVEAEEPDVERIGL